ncbi:MAG: Hint domain-containing protein [Pseudomonadota bacterium]
MSSLNLDTSASANAMAEEILGPGFNIVSATYSGNTFSSGIYDGYVDTTLGTAGVLPSEQGVILSTGFATNFSNATGGNNQSGSRSGNTGGIEDDPDFNAAAGGSTDDASFLVIEFEPLAGQTSLNLEFRFYSEEYNEYVYSNFNDVALVMIDGVQIPISAGDGTISVNSINNAGTTPPTNGNQANDPNPTNGVFDSSNPNLYIDNTDGSEVTEFDGFTVTLSLDIPVTPGVQQELKIGVADKGDELWDSALVIASNAQTSGTDTDPIAVDDALSVNGLGPTNFDLLANDTDPNMQTLTITEINGVPVVAGSVVDLPSGERITLNPDGTITVERKGAPVGNKVFTYTITDTDGNTDSAFVQMNTTTPCFTPGALIDTAAGPRPVETLRVGDLVITRDEGVQPIRWIGRRRMSAWQLKAEARFRPVVIRKDAFGPGCPHRAIAFSPQHRVLLRSAEAMLMFGETEVLSAAKNLGTEQADVSKGVDYIHLLFDRHQIIYADGLATESLHPGRVALEGFDAPARAEVLTLFPELRVTRNGYGKTARYALTTREARALSLSA